MGWRMRKSIKIGKNTRLNLNKKGFSVSTGTKGARVTVNNKGKVTRTVGIPGTGIYNTKQYDLNKKKDETTNKRSYKGSTINNSIQNRIENNPYALGFTNILTKEEKKALKMPKKAKIIIAIGFAFFVIGFLFVPMMVFALFFLLLGYLMIPLTKDGRYYFKMGIAETMLMKKGKDDCIRWLSGALKTHPNDPIAQKIINELI